MASVQSHLELSEYRKQQARGDQALVPDLVTAVILTCFLFPADHKPRNATVSRVLHFFRCPGWCGEQGTVAFSSGEGASAAQISGWVHRLPERKFSNRHASRTAHFSPLSDFFKPSQDLTERMSAFSRRIITPPLPQSGELYLALLTGHRVAFSAASLAATYSSGFRRHDRNSYFFGGVFP